MVPQPVCVAPEGIVKDGDGVLFFNFRADRARELSEAFTDPDFAGFPRKRKLTINAIVQQSVSV